ncbi:stalk domain-containing protein [Paenibacillus validus]|uniref:stalk domain-containing protein n=1 Tax=Paenibacillus validus TaxID=44253 RepID=UPI003D2AAFB7
MNKKVVTALALATTLATSATVFAEGGLKSIQVLFERIHVAVNGQQAELGKDSILYNGSIYVPLRSLAEMLGAEVSWNDANRSVNLDFIKSQSAALQASPEQGIYQYVAMTNNSILSELLKALKTTDTGSMQSIRERYLSLEDTVRDLQDEELANSFAKMAAAVELLRGGWESKNLDDYSIAWTIFNTNAEKVNAMLKAKLQGSTASAQN